MGQFPEMISLNVSTWTKKTKTVVFLPSRSCNTLPETNIAPKNGWLEYYFPIGEAYFQGLC